MIWWFGFTDILEILLGNYIYHIHTYKATWVCIFLLEQLQWYASLIEAIMQLLLRVFWSVGAAYSPQQEWESQAKVCWKLRPAQRQPLKVLTENKCNDEYKQEAALRDTASRGISKICHSIYRGRCNIPLRFHSYIIFLYFLGLSAVSNTWVCLMLAPKARQVWKIDLRAKQHIYKSGPCQKRIKFMPLSCIS